MTSAVTQRPPVVTILGHIDHGKSTLLDYIRKTKTAEDEAGGITQHIAGYEVVHTSKESGDRAITFLDTPGHAAFSGIRSRGVFAADIAILIVSAEDGMMPQTIEAYQDIKKAEVPFIVAINKIDRPNANVEKTKQSLAENEIYIEEYGGTVPAVALSAITGEGVPDLLEMIILMADMEELTGDPEQPAEGVVIESNVDPKKGIRSTIVIKNGSLKKGMVAVSGNALCPVRMMYDFQGVQIDEATFSSPIGLVGWNTQPQAGSLVTSFSNKKEAEQYAKEHTQEPEKKEVSNQQFVIPVILKADTMGSIEAIEKEIEKINTKGLIGVISKDIGAISENDIRTAMITENTVVLGFNVTIDPAARQLRDQLNVLAKTFDIIYELQEWLETYAEEKRPRERTEEVSGKLKVLKVFSRVKQSSVLGGKVSLGMVRVGDAVNIYRNSEKVGTGKIKELQQQKVKSDSVTEGMECGAKVESSLEINHGDILEAFVVTEK